MHTHLGEALVFWRLAFSPTYERELIKSAILGCLGSHDVRSAIAYELFGVHDLLLRVWVPGTTTLKRVEADLIDALVPHDILDVEVFTVSYPVRHWPFRRPNEPFHWPENNDIHNLLSATNIATIDDGSASISLVERAEHQGVMKRYDAPPDPELPGIKFAMVVRGGEDVDFYRFEAALKYVLDAADRIGERSLYAGDGFAHFLVMGKVTYENFHAINEQLLVPFNAALVREEFSARTFTHLSGQRGFLISEERLTGPAFSPPERMVGIVTSDDEQKLSALVPGYVFAGRYELLNFVDYGGFSLVYRVHDHDVNKVRALKVLRSRDTAGLSREITFLQAITHPSVVKAYGGDVAEGLVYLVEEFVDGESLYTRMHGESPPDDADSIRICLALLDALAAIHPDYERIAELRDRNDKGGLADAELEEFMRLRAEGIVHRDVKPLNIILRTGSHEPVLIDFNIASRVGDNVETTKHTPAYTPPDFGNEPRWDTSIDLFAVGVIAYELLCHNHPYTESDPKLGQGPIDPSASRQDLPESVRAWLLRATATSRADRFRTARQMQAALQAAEADLRELGR
jgi:hypothetical protein